MRTGRPVALARNSRSACSWHALTPKVAADIDVVKQELLLRYPGRSRQGLACIVGHLAAHPDMHAAAVVDVDKHGLWFDVALVDALHVGILENEIGLGKAALQVTFCEKGPVVGIEGFDIFCGKPKYELKSGCRIGASSLSAACGSNTAGSSSYSTSIRSRAL